MNRGILHDLPAIVVYELVAKRGDINRKRQGEDRSDPPPRRKTGSGGRNPLVQIPLPFG
jgi:hypothetical protein